jgi:hypothetical protein
MDNLEDIEERVDQIFQKSEDLNAELYALGAMSERHELFETLRELIHEKEMEGDEVAAQVLGWAWQRLSN